MRGWGGVRQGGLRGGMNNQKGGTVSFTIIIQHRRSKVHTHL
jgi:hypothetical protein